MRISEFVVLLCLFLSFLAGQEVSMIVPVKDLTDLEDLKDSLKREFKLKGYLNASVECLAVEAVPGTQGQIRTVWKVRDSSPVSVDSITISGSTAIRSSTVSNILQPLDGKPASHTTLRKARNLVTGYSFLNVKDTPYYAVYGTDRVALVIPVEEQFRNAFSGLAGYQPGPQMMGEIQLHLENPFGTASSTDLTWQRKDAQSQVLSLSHEEPFVWKSSLGAKFLFYQNLQDGLYVIRKSRISAVKTYSSTGKWSVGVENVSVKVTSEGVDREIRNHAVRSMVVENEWERRDFLLNPTGGFFFSWSAEAGDFSRSGGGDAYLLRAASRFEFIKALFGNWVLSLGGTAGYVHITGGISVPLGEKFRYGGASSLRGYAEQLFRADAMVIAQLEMRYLTSRYGRLYFFVDGSRGDAASELPLSGGLGIQQKTPLGIFRVEYAMNRGELPSKGKIHLRLVGQF